MFSLMILPRSVQVLALDPPVDGLLFHLDAQQLPTELEEQGKPPINTGDPVEHWPSSAGSTRVDFSATPEGTRPVWQSVGSQHVVRFDGSDDAMRFISSWNDRPQLTLWLVVAPHQNDGDFRGLIASNAPGERDYVSGMNVDLGPGPSRAWDFVNIEGRGFSGAQDLLPKQLPFGTLHILQIVADATSGHVEVFVDGESAGSRPMNADSVAVREWTLGARYYTNGPGSQQVRGSFRGDIAEVLAYDRTMDEVESKTLFEALQSKYASLAAELPASLPNQPALDPLVPFANPPLVQMLIPGFEAHRIPIELTNVNNVRYRHDGALITLGYNGDLHVLRDTDGDGLEDSKKIFYRNTGSLRGPIGMQWTKPDDPRGQGCFVASKGKISFFIDRDGDDQADDEQIVAQGWEEIPQNVDAVGLAIDRDGWIYFGLGTANYANAYLVDDAGNSKYDLKSDRGTIQRVSPDFSKRETVCTGVRFPIGLDFNAQGDLFCTDQEGATWLPNGNPFDELLHIRRGKHYGFPPRHPKYNPSVIDEPSVFDYGPQHQSTCGMFINPAASDRSHFGPAAWEGDAIVTGESRGKLWRTQLAKTTHGYVAQSQLIACLQMLTIDACPSPDGAMVVACHSGPPDWGTGPAGIGELLKIVPIKTEVEVPRPALSWFSSPDEIAIAFDAPLDPDQVKTWLGEIDVYAGPYVRAGDRYENLSPPYAVVRSQSLTPRRRIDVSSIGISPDRRTLHVRIPAQRIHEHYAVRLPSAFASPGKGIEQRPEMEIDVAPFGVYASWVSDADPSVAWSGVLPHWDLDVAKAWSRGSAEHDRLWDRLREPGILRMRTNLDIVDVLRPKVQPGSSIDYSWPNENVTLRVSGALTGLELKNGPEEAIALTRTPTGEHRIPAIFTIEGSDASRHPSELQAAYRTGDSNAAQPGIAIHTDEDMQDRAVSLHRFRLPGFESRSASPLEDGVSVAKELKGGDWGRGRHVFRGAKARCASCHNEPGMGATRIGPDLSNLVHRDYASVMRDILHPNYAINPEFIGHKVRLHDGTILVGVLREKDGQLLLGDSEGNTTSIAKDTIETMSPSATSTMPTGLFDTLSDSERTDLMAYLLRPPPSMPLERPNQAPPLRTAAEVAKVLEGSVVEGQTYRQLRIVLVAGPKDHGPNEHDYPAWLIQWGQLLAAADHVAIDTAWEFPSAEQLASADVLLFFQKGDWNRERAQAMDAYFQRGGGAMYLHWAVNGNESAPDFAKRIGIASRGGLIRFRHGPLMLRIDHPQHPILRNIERLELLDESYWLLSRSELPVDILASSEEDGSHQPQLWTAEPGKGRVLVSIPGHYSWTFDDPIFRTVLLRGIAWIAREPIDRFNELVPLGARMTK